MNEIHYLLPIAPPNGIDLLPADESEIARLQEWFATASGTVPQMPWWGFPYHLVQFGSTAASYLVYYETVILKAIKRDLPDIKVKAVRAIETNFDTLMFQVQTGSFVFDGLPTLASSPVKREPEKPRPVSSFVYSGTSINATITDTLEYKENPLFYRHAVSAVGQDGNIGGDSFGGFVFGKVSSPQHRFVVFPKKWMTAYTAVYAIDPVTTMEVPMIRLGDMQDKTEDSYLVYRTANAFAGQIKAKVFIINAG